MKFWIPSCYLIFIASIVAQLPGDREDAENERRKILRAADLVDSIQVQQETVQARVTEIESKLKSILEKFDSLISENQKLRSDLATLKSALEKSEDARLKEREVLLKEIGSIVSEKTKSIPSTGQDALLKVREEETVSKPKSSEASSEKPENGFYYTVQKGDTLAAISEAYKQNGINVSVQDIREANHLSKKDIIKTGQKLFIPKK